MIRNLTPHTVTIRTASIDLSYAPETDRPPVRITDTAIEAGQIDAIEIMEISTTGVTTGLPPAQAGVSLIVSRLVAAANPDRRDLLFPYGEIRDKRARIVAVGALARIASE